MTTREEIDKTIEDLRRLIEQAVRNEQLRHQLTGLPNATALAGHLQSAMESAIDRDEQFWLGFIEIDRFKSINDQFGYERADILLLEVARMIEQTASRFFAGQAVAFHAHGDEFYVLGFVHPIAFTTQDITDKLGAIRGAIASIALPARSGAGLIKCTVSIGWTMSLAATASELMHEVEIAVAHAKRRGRNRIDAQGSGRQLSVRVLPVRDLLQLRDPDRGPARWRRILPKLRHPGATPGSRRARTSTTGHHRSTARIAAPCVSQSFSSSSGDSVSLIEWYSVPPSVESRVLLGKRGIGQSSSSGWTSLAWPRSSRRR